MSYAGVPEVTPAEAAARVGEGAVLVDVREEDEWQAGHAPGARHMPLSRLQQDYRSLAPDVTIIAVCRVGGRSAQATLALRGVGYDVVNLAGGMQSWAAAGHPVVTDDGGAGTVI
ncbi:MAG: rhodanese-like domain-containing protein [Actinobacteria bacterium]|nr:rhodanese-like domain-containing protein [Actinomycetota bacterium]